jgi:trehalose 6-phosphate synthase
MKETEQEVQRINKRFQTHDCRPIVFLNEHHSHAEIQPYYRAADFCMVNSLHDGMNLVAKEFVAARDDLRGVLILSRFTGAAQELTDALIVNPYDTESVADSIKVALDMNSEEVQARMQRMRALVRDRNVYRWAAKLIEALCEIRPVAAKEEPSSVARAAQVG